MVSYKALNTYFKSLFFDCSHTIRNPYSLQTRTIIERRCTYDLQRIRQYDRLQFRHISKNRMSKPSLSQPKDNIRKRNGFNIPTAITTAPKLPYYIKTVGLRIFHSRRYNYVFHVVIHRHNGNKCRAVKTTTAVLYSSLKT